MGLNNNGTCSRCHRSVTSEDFHKGNTSWCKLCCAAYKREYRDKNPERVRSRNAANTLRWAQNNREYKRAYDKKYNVEHAVERRAYNRMLVHGITAEEFDAILESQGGLCAICRDEFQSSKHTHVDHDHDTGRVRGILCQSCNLILGHAKDSPDRLRSAAVYLDAGGRSS